MLSVTPRSIFAGAILSALSIPAAFAAPSLVVNQDSIGIQTPAIEPGLRYQADSATSASLTAYTDGFLLCANVGNPVTSSIVKLVPRHETADAHQWTFPSAVDALPVTYRNGVFSINRQADGVRPSTLTCNSLGPQGEWGSAYMDGIFADGFWNTTEVPANNYGNMVNWNPPAGGFGATFDWSNPSWASVPQDPCILGPNDLGTMRVDEAVACGAATGILLAGLAGATRGARMWVGTRTVGLAVNLTYVFRVDATLGTQANRLSDIFELPVLMGNDATGLENFSVYAVRDAFDETLLSGEGSWCTLQSLPSTLGANVCDGAIYGGAMTVAEPFVGFNFVLGTTPDGAGTTRSSFYVAVTRSVINSQSQPGPNSPVVTASVFVEPSVVAEGGNQFRGDDVVFGFVPTSTGFPWMKGGPANP